MIALAMIASGLFRVCVWFLLIVTYVAHVAAIRSLYASVSFVALLSVLALLLTDWGQVAASLAQLSASDAHHDAEAARTEVQLDYRQLERDIARLANLVGPEAHELEYQILQKLHA